MSNNTPVSTDTDCIPVSQIEFVSHTNFSTKKLKLDTPPLRNKLAWCTDQGRKKSCSTRNVLISKNCVSNFCHINC